MADSSSFGITKWNSSVLDWDCGPIKKHNFDPLEGAEGIKTYY